MRRPSRLRKLVCAAFLAVASTRVPLLRRLALEAARALGGQFKDRRFLAAIGPWPWISPRASVAFPGRVDLGRGAFIDDDCVVYGGDAGTHLTLGERATIWRGTVLHCEGEGFLEIGADTHVQPYCSLTAAGPLRIGAKVQIAPGCRLYPYDHSFDDPHTPMQEQPLRHRGGIEIEDDVWLGANVVVLDGVRIGRGAVVAAGAVVRESVPSGAIVGGVPARVLRYRPGFEES